MDMKKTNSIILIALSILLMVMFPPISFAENNDEITLEKKTSLYGDVSFKEVIYEIPINTIINIISKEENSLYISFTHDDEESNKLKMEGYIKLSDIANSDEEIDKGKNDGNYEETKQPNSENETLNIDYEVGEKLQGIVKKDSTEVKTNLLEESSTLTTLPIGTILEYNEISITDNWYELTVEMDGKEETGFIEKMSVENLSNSQSTVNGLTKKSPTNVRESPSTK